MTARKRAVFANKRCSASLICCAHNRIACLSYSAGLGGTRKGEHTSELLTRINLHPRNFCKFVVLGIAFVRPYGAASASALD